MKTTTKRNGEAVPIKVIIGIAWSAAITAALFLLLVYHQSIPLF